LATLGRIALAKNDFGAARENLEKSLEIRLELAEETSIAESQSFLAQLALAENRPADAISLAQPAADVFSLQQAPATASEPRALLALAHLAAGEQSAAQTEIIQAANLADKSENKLTRIFVR